MARPPLDTAAATFPSRSTTTAPTVSRHPEPFSYKCTFSNESFQGNIKEKKSKHSHSEAETSSLTTDIYKINDVMHEFMNHSPLPFIFHHKCAVVISISCFTSLIAVCFGSELFVNHHDSDCMINRVLQGKCAKWHHDTWSELHSYQKLKIFIEPWTKSKKNSVSHLSHTLLNQPCLRLLRPKKPRANYFEMLQRPSCHPLSVSLNEKIHSK